jgi:ABC-type transporter Mla subunit MlaD
MLTKESPRLPVRGLVTAAILAAAMSLPALTATATDAERAELNGSAPTVEELRGIVADLGSVNDALAADNSSLQQTVSQLEQERDQLRKSLDRFDKLYAPLEADRQLLVELRKSLPETRPEAEAQLARIRDLALASDPARLGRIIDRLDDAVPTFLDWRFGDYGSVQAYTDAYVETGANAFDSSMEEFRSEVLMSVANRLDSLLTILDRVR